MRYLSVVLCVFLLSCSNHKKYDLIDLSDCVVLDSAEVIYDFDDKYPTSLMIKDSLAYVICTHADTCLSVIDLKTKRLQATLGTVGYGANDVINPNFILSIHDSGILLDVGNLRKIMRVENMQDTIILKEDILYPEPVFMGSELNFSAKHIVGRKVDGKGEKMFFVYDRADNTLLEADCFPPLAGYVKDKNYVYAPTLAMNEEQNRIIVGMYFFDMFHVYDFSGKRLNTFSFSENCVPEVDRKTDFLKLEDGYSGIVRTFPTEKYCFLLRNTMIPDKGERSMLLQTDWNGRLIRSYLFKDHVMGQFYVDEQCKNIYIIRHSISSDDKELFSVVSYQL